MDNWEKIIKGLEHCILFDDFECADKECPYYKNCGATDTPKELIHDVFTLLKAQEPRVLKLEELLPVPKTDVWLEYEDSVTPASWTMTTKDTIGFYCHGFISDGRGMTNVLLLDEYGEYWRCWSARPTDEQRETTPWDS